MSPHQKAPSRVWILLAAVAMAAVLIWVRSSRTPVPPSPPPVPTPAATPLATQAAVPTTVEVFVPDADGRLQRRKVRIKAAAEPSMTQRARLAAQHLLSHAAGNFPPGTRLMDFAGTGSPIRQRGGVVEVNFNQAFLNNEFWQGETRVQAGVYAIVNTLATAEGKQSKVQLLVEGKPLDVIGEMDVHDPIAPDLSLVAKS